jgi:hemerythrin-like domain-containing protein
MRMGHEMQLNVILKFLIEILKDLLILGANGLPLDNRLFHRTSIKFLLRYHQSNDHSLSERGLFQTLLTNFKQLEKIIKCFFNEEASFKTHEDKMVSFSQV